MWCYLVPYLVSLPFTTTANSSRVHIPRPLQGSSHRLQSLWRVYLFLKQNVPSSNLKIPTATSFCQIFIPRILDPETSVYILQHSSSNTTQSFIRKFRTIKMIKFISPSKYMLPLYTCAPWGFSSPYTCPCFLSISYSLTHSPFCCMWFSSPLFVFFSHPLNNSPHPLHSFIPSHLLLRNSSGRDGERAQGNCEDNDHTLLSRFEEVLRNEHDNLSINKFVKL